MARHRANHCWKVRDKLGVETLEIVNPGVGSASPVQLSMSTSTKEALITELSLTFGDATKDGTKFGASRKVR